MKSILKLSAYLITALLFATAAFAIPSAVEIMDSANEAFVYEETVEELMNEGTENNPYIISSAEEFNEYAKLINSGNSAYSDKYYKLSGNIDFEGKEIIPFGTHESGATGSNGEKEDNGSLSFKGTLDGNGYAIENVGVSGAYYSGVIGFMTKGTVKNLAVSYVSDGFSPKEEKFKFGGIVGKVKPLSEIDVVITGCEARGNLEFVTDCSVYAGGIVGHIETKKANLVVSDCVSYVSFDIESAANGYAGGITSYAVAGSSKNFIFKNCISYGDVSYVNTARSSATVGGFAGHINKDESGWSDFMSENASLFATLSNFENCAALGDVYAQAKNSVAIGAFAAEMAGAGTPVFTNCYTPENQVVEGNAPKIESDFASAATTKSEEAINTKEFYSSLGYDFDHKWYLSSSGLNLRTTAKQHDVATVYDNVSLRLSKNKAGLRFTAEIDAVKRDYCYEYGFIVATEEAVGDGELTFDTVPKGVGVGYNSEKGIDIIYDETDEKKVFTGVVYNIKNEHYSDVILARAYLSYYCDGELVTVYGNVVKGSVSETASKLYNDKEIFDSLTPEQKEILESMLPEA